MEEFKGRVRGGEASHGDQDRWRRWQVGGDGDGDGDIIIMNFINACIKVSVGALRGYLEADTITGMLKVLFGRNKFIDDQTV